MKITLPPEKSKQQTLFSKLTVADTMRKRVVTLTADHGIDKAIRTLVKFKIDAVLITDREGLPAGVVTRTELMGAYYAVLPITTPLGDIMGSPVIGCSPDESLESAMLTMQEAQIHRLYVIDQNGLATGTLAYPDIVGALYRYCCKCDYGLRRKTAKSGKTRLRHTIKEAMTPGVTSTNIQESIQVVIEKLTTFRFGALLVVDDNNVPAGVISKADLVLAYLRGTPLGRSAGEAMSSPAHLCCEEKPLEEGIRRMVLNEVSRLFIFGKNEKYVNGVLSLSDAARMRSGSCQACTSTRIKVKE